MTKVRSVIIGSGNIGTDLLYKLRRSDILDPYWMVGIEPDSAGLARAAALGLKTTHQGLAARLEEIAADQVKIAFDATSAAEHAKHAALLENTGILSVDLTPAAIGPYCVPPVNLEHLRNHVADVNLVSCGGQATIPIVAAVARVQTVAYAEIVATVASKSAGPGTRKNIDEFTRTTARGLERVGGAKQGKAIIILNPAEPPLIMRNTVHCLTDDAEPDRARIEKSLADMRDEVQRYVPGYRFKNDVVFDGRRVSVYLEIEGRGDFLPTYAGNLDIMTAAATRAGEMFGQEILRADGVAEATA